MSSPIPHPSRCYHLVPAARHLRNQLNDTTGFLDLALSLLAHPPGADDDGDLWEPALSEHLGVSEGEEVEDGGGVGLLAGNVGVTSLFGDERPKLYSQNGINQPAAQSSQLPNPFHIFSTLPIDSMQPNPSSFRLPTLYPTGAPQTYLVQVDHGLPELVLSLVEVPHTDFTEVTGVVLVEVRAVVVLTTGHTTTTGVLPVLANTTVTGRDVAAARKSRKKKSVAILERAIIWGVLVNLARNRRRSEGTHGCGRCRVSGNGVQRAKILTACGSWTVW